MREWERDDRIRMVRLLYWPDCCEVEQREAQNDLKILAVAHHDEKGVVENDQRGDVCEIREEENSRHGPNLEVDAELVLDVAKLERAQEEERAQDELLVHEGTHCHVQSDVVLVDVLPVATLEHGKTREPNRKALVKDGDNCADHKWH